jgi:pimeloyl-ACP methyl ester carboxylesterase
MGTALDLAVWIAVLVAFGFAAALAIYVLGSFLLMARHTAARGLVVSTRELLREAILAALTQPFLPLFYLVGHRMDGLLAGSARRGLAAEAGAEGGTARVPIVFVHGYMQNRVGFVGLARALARRGLGPMFAINYPWFSSVEANAARLERYVLRVCRETNSPHVDLVCHSMGGLVAMEMMRDDARDGRLHVRRCVTIATPHAGVMWRGPILGVGAATLRRGSKLLLAHAGAQLTVPWLSIYSTHDNIVHPKETSQLSARGGRDIEVAGLAHLSILFSPQVADHVAAFLREPEASAASTTVGVDAEEPRASSPRIAAEEQVGEGGPGEAAAEVEEISDDAAPPGGASRER